MNLFNIKVVGETFTAEVHVDDLPEVILDTVKVGKSNTVQIEGGFDVEWDDQYPLITVTELSIDNVDISPLVSEESLESVATEIESVAGYELWIDREAARADALYDQMKEGN